MTKSRNPVRVCSRIGLALFLMMLVWYLAANGITAAAQLFAPYLLEDPWIIWMVNDVPLYALGMPVFLLVLHFIPDGPQAPRYTAPVGVGRFLLIVLFCLGGGYLLNLIMGLILMALQLLFTGSGQGNSLQDLIFAGGPLPGLVFGVLVPATGEEFLFRYMLRRKMQGAGDKIYIFFSALCFSLFHANLVQIPYTFVIGAALAWLYLISGRLWLCMLAHFIINLLGIVVMPLLMEADMLLVGAYGMLMLLVLIPAGVALFVTFWRRAMVAMQPPCEGGWPYTQTRPHWRQAGQPARWPADPYAPPVAAEPPPPRVGYGYAAYGHQGHYGQAYGHYGPAAYGQGCGHYPPAYGYGQPHSPQPAPHWQGHAAPPAPKPQPHRPGAWQQYGPHYPAGQPAAVAAPQPAPAAPVYAQPYTQQQPYAQAYPYGQPQPYGGPFPGYDPSAAARANRRFTARICLGNAGMVMYMVLAGLLSLLALAVQLGLLGSV